ncbi:MAG TPA: glycosyltransferase [Candidatus Limnocylindrales bacterium]|nr:glycosyltransferase [Candidatus Limnocylindrales bacterium]
MGAPIPAAEVPVPETASEQWRVRALALVALAVTAVYLTWRTTSTVDLSVWWVSIPLLLFEIHAAVGLGLFTFSLWDVDDKPVTAKVEATAMRIAVLVPTYNEGIEVLMPTVAAAVAMRLPHETWVLDDGNREDVAALARDLGARYVARPTHEHAKAGNINHALALIEADFIAVLDADHVATSEFLVDTLGYFDDPRVALVQTPQEFYNIGSFEHDGSLPDGERFHEQLLFYRVLQPAKNRWNAAFWCGTGAVVRLSALRDVGGVATETITEDIHTTIRFHRRGWRTVYHNEVLARGLAASDADTYQLQRHRWGTGAMQVLRTENPLFVPGLTLGQRLSYAATLLGWFDAWRSLGYLLLPIIIVTTGAIPIRADALTFSIAFGTTFILQQFALRVLSRGRHRSVVAVVFELVRMTPNLLATLTLLTNQRATFRVTPKGRHAGDRHRTRVPRLLRTLAFMSFLGAAWFALTLLGATPTRYVVPWAAYAAFGWLVVNVFLLVLAIRRVRNLRFAPERRSSVRFDTDMPGLVGGIPCRVLDLSLTGARLTTREPLQAGQPGALEIELGGEPVSLDAFVRSVRPLPNGDVAVGLEFEAGQHAGRARLALGLFGMRWIPSAEPVGGLSKRRLSGAATQAA